MAALAIGATAWLEWPPPAPPPLAQRADEATLRAEAPTALTITRFAPNPAILVLDFPTLAEQGRMLNRVAAWAEKNGAPHDRLLNDAELDAAIRASGATPDTYYYGHDYRAADLARFFATARSDHVALRPEEERLGQILGQATAEPMGAGAVISLTRVGGDVDAGSRTAILHHELAHGEYFTNDTYARYVHSIWQDVLTATERAQFRTYLTSEGYDPALEDLMVNEMQAYLMHTPDPRFFDETLLGIPAPRLAAIRAAFRAGMPSCWLRDATPEPPRQASTAPRCRPYGRVSSTTASAVRLPPRRRRASIAA